ncbi:hypothetical protein [Streptomyces sp. KL116D]|uniref:hypothetical protein n=1 Tax=Streptomyces sp. KL116D TaxID=3045152 RepID=UPI003557902B
MIESIHTAAVRPPVVGALLRFVAVDPLEEAGRGSVRLDAVEDAEDVHHILPT